MLTTVQDLGRWGFQSQGVPVAGPMDPFAHRVANALVGNDVRDATLEVTLVGPEIGFDAPTTFAVAGGEFDLFLDGEPAPTHRACRVGAGGRLRFGDRRSGARAYLAIAGGLDVPLVLGSHATHVLSRMGGLQGRPLARGDRIAFGRDGLDRAVPSRIPRLPELPRAGACMRVMWGPHADRFTGAARTALGSGRYRITPESNRMGYRLEGPVLSHAGSADLISEATPLGGLQVPASGQPILLMADRQTSGGYPMLATVITADLRLAGQLAPGDWIAFRPCDLAEAVRALITQERSLMSLAEGRPDDSLT